MQPKFPLPQDSKRKSFCCDGTDSPSKHFFCEIELKRRSVQSQVGYGLTVALQTK